MTRLMCQIILFQHKHIWYKNETDYGSPSCNDISTAEVQGITCSSTACNETILNNIKIPKLF